MLIWNRGTFLNQLRVRRLREMRIYRFQGMLLQTRRVMHT